jgi:hypothetical protein
VIDAVLQSQTNVFEVKQSAGELGFGQVEQTVGVD